ncbi:MAG: methyltransferase domain-containing protein [Gemmatimonas sp.]|nr:methyltransferase domain-containing protein [Gemmatimonas sp.]
MIRRTAGGSKRPHRRPRPDGPGFHNPRPSWTTELHQERLDAVAEVIAASGARNVVDLGCGTGLLLERLAGHAQFDSLAGMDASPEAIATARDRLRSAVQESGERVSLFIGSFAQPHPELDGYHAAAMVETIEHVPPEQLSKIERVVFEYWAPDVIVMTTPNREYNPLLGVPEGSLRHPDHRFEWSRAKFQRWAEGVAERCGYRAEFRGIGRKDPLAGSATQMAIFRRRPEGVVRKENREAP